MTLPSLPALELPEPKAPMYYEIWKWEGDPTVLPGTWLGCIQKAFGSPFADGWTTARFTEEFGPSKPQFDPEGIFFITTRSKCAGTCMLWQDDPADKTTARLHWLGVDPAHRRKGIARTLALLVLKRAQERGFQKVVLRTEVSQSDSPSVNHAPPVFFRVLKCVYCILLCSYFQ